MNVRSWPYRIIAGGLYLADNDFVTLELWSSYEIIIDEC